MHASPYSPTSAEADDGSLFRLTASRSVSPAKVLRMLADAHRDNPTLLGLFDYRSVAQVVHRIPVARDRAPRRSGRRAGHVSAMRSTSAPPDEPRPRSAADRVVAHLLGGAA